MINDQHTKFQTQLKTVELLKSLKKIYKHCSSTDYISMQYFQTFLICLMLFFL